MIPTAIIAEDEPLLRNEIRHAFAALWPELAILAEAGDGIETIRAMDQWQPRILFLDIQMPGLSGLEVARHVSGKAHVVFISAYDQYALAAFEQGALDYIQKPISLDRLSRTIARLKERLREAPADLSGLAELLKSAAHAEVKHLKWLTVPKGAELQVVAVADISYLRADNKYTTVVTRSASYLLNSSLREMQEKLDPEMFWQIHRGIIVNVGAVERIYRSFRGAMEVKVREREELLPVSSAHAHRFRHA